MVCGLFSASSLASKEALEYWSPVDWYNGGMEHTTLHLLYSRFWHKFLYDIGVTTTKEPYMKRTSHGMILGEDGQKMSKSRGNVINPDDVVKEYGADTLRLYESTGKDTTAVVELPFAGVACPVSLKGFEIKTLHYDEQTKQLAEADLLD